MNSTPLVEHAPTRRRLLQVGGGMTLLAVAGCTSSPPDARQGPRPSETGAGGTAVPADREAPMLAQLVEQGELPPLEERLPESPLVVEPHDRLGTYGGTWRSAALGNADTNQLSRTMGYEGLMRWDPEWTTAIPNVAESITPSDDGREFTIVLRRGMKWSDGHPFTTDDIMFAYEDFYLNTDLTPVVPEWLVTGDEPATMEQADEQTFRLTYSQPNGLFILNMARPRDGAFLLIRPRHYLEQFHITYNPDANDLAAEEGFADWVELFQARMGEPWENKEKPTLYPWIITTEVGESNRIVAERNPYYWKLDTEGRQLPYLDQVIYDVLSNEEVVLLKVQNGELDFHARHFNSLPNRPVVAETRESGNYDFVTLNNSFMNEMLIEFNLTHEDAALREIFQNKDFRIGLSHAIDRQEMINAVWQQQGEPWQAAPLRTSRFFDEEFAKQYTEFNVDLANDHLDRAGLTQRDSSGMRLRPDGEPFSFSVEVVTPAQIPFWVEAMELVTGYWRAVGIEARIEPEERSLFTERLLGGQHEASVWEGPGGYNDEVFRPFAYFPSQPGFPHSWARSWQSWYLSRGQDGEEPPAETRRQMELYWQLTEEVDEQRQDELFNQILQIAKEQFYLLGTVAVPERYGIVRNDFHNVPTEMPESADYWTPGPTNPEQYFTSR